MNLEEVKDALCFRFTTDAQRWRHRGLWRARVGRRRDRGDSRGHDHPEGREDLGGGELAAELREARGRMDGYGRGGGAPQEVQGGPGAGHRRHPCDAGGRAVPVRLEPARRASGRVVRRANPGALIYAPARCGGGALPAAAAATPPRQLPAGPRLLSWPRIAPAGNSALWTLT